MLARLLFAAVALCLIGALPDAHATRAANAPSASGMAAAGAGTASGAVHEPARALTPGAGAPRGR